MDKKNLTQLLTEVPQTKTFLEGFFKPNDLEQFLCCFCKKPFEKEETGALILSFPAVYNKLELMRDFMAWITAVNANSDMVIITRIRDVIFIKRQDFKDKDSTADYIDALHLCVPIQRFGRSADLVNEIPLFCKIVFE